MAIADARDAIEKVKQRCKADVASRGHQPLALPIYDRDMAFGQSVTLMLSIDPHTE